MVVVTPTTWEKRLVSTIITGPTFRRALTQFLTPQVFKQAHQAAPPKPKQPRWPLHALVWVLLSMSWCAGDSQEERFATAGAVYVASHQHSRRPGTTLAGFLKALARLPLPVLRALSRGVRGQIGDQLLDALRVNGWALFACDGTRVECPRSAELQQRLGEAGKPASAPMAYITTLVALPAGLLWSWALGKGTANELEHLRRLLPTLPPQALVVADAFYLGYDLFRAIMQARASFLVRLSSRVCLYTLAEQPLEQFAEGPVYYWPKEYRDRPPLLLRLLRIRGGTADVWLLTDVLDRQRVSHRLAAQIYRWRWKNEGLFRVYKRMLRKVKLESRTVAVLHRELEGSLLALQVLLAVSAQASQRGDGAAIVIQDSPRRVLLRIRGEMAAGLRTLGPRQFRRYQHRLAVVRTGARERTSSKVRQEWPRRKEHKPPKPPKIRVMDPKMKAKLAKVLEPKITVTG
jgi:hypothetical protein